MRPVKPYLPETVCFSSVVSSLDFFSHLGTFIWLALLIPSKKKEDTPTA